MKQPLIPYDLYDKFLWTSRVEIDNGDHFKKLNVQLIFALLKLKYWIKQLPRINFDTLKFHMQVFKMIVKNEPLNKMSAYNVAITVGPNIFRPKSTRPEDITNVGSYYELIIQMIQQYDLLFDASVEYHHILQRAKDENGNLLRKNLGADAGIGQINLDPLKKHLGLEGEEKGQAL